MIQDLTRGDVEDILYGATLLGAGGGGELAEGLALLDMAEAAGKRFRMIALEDVADDAVICTPYMLGAISDLPEGAAALVGGSTHPILVAYERLADYLGDPIFGAVPCEMGGSNTAVPFFVAAMADIVVVDADPAGRAVPEITHSSYALAALPPAPIVAANVLGETFVLEGIQDDARAEDVVRALARQSQNDIAAIDHAFTAGTLRSAILPGTLSKARHLGQVLRARKHDPAALPDALAKAAGGAVLFEGAVVSSGFATEHGFTVGRFELAGTGAHHGHAFAVDFKNENMVGFRDGRPAVTIPEIISVLDRDTGDVVTNPNITVGQDVAVLVLPAPDLFLTPKGLQLFGPGYAGLDTEFKSALG